MESSGDLPASKDTADGPEDERLRTLEAVAADVPALSGQLQEATEQRREADRQLDEARREADTARTNAASLEQALAEARGRAAALERDAEQARELLEAAVGERDALAAALQAKDARLAELAADTTALEEALSAARADAADTARRRDKADEEVSTFSRVDATVACITGAASVQRHVCTLVPAHPWQRQPIMHLNLFPLRKLSNSGAAPSQSKASPVTARGSRGAGLGRGSDGGRGGDCRARRARGGSAVP